MIGRGRVLLLVLTVGYEIAWAPIAEPKSALLPKDMILTAEFAQGICPVGPGSGGSVNCSVAFVALGR